MHASDGVTQDVEAVRIVATVSKNAGFVLTSTSYPVAARQPEYVQDNDTILNGVDEPLGGPDGAGAAKLHTVVGGIVVGGLVVGGLVVGGLVVGAVVVGGVVVGGLVVGGVVVGGVVVVGLVVWVVMTDGAVVVVAAVAVVDVGVLEVVVVVSDPSVVGAWARSLGSTTTVTVTGSEMTAPALPSETTSITWLPIASRSIVHRTCASVPDTSSEFATSDPSTLIAIRETPAGSVACPTISISPGSISEPSSGAPTHASAAGSGLDCATTSGTANAVAGSMEATAKHTAARL